MPDSWIDDPADDESADDEHADDLTDFTVAVSAATDRSTLIVRIVGELDIATAPELVSTVARAFAENDPVSGPTAIRFDLDELTFIDASGLRALIASAHDLPVHIAGARPAARRLFDITGIARSTGVDLDIE